MAKATAQSAAFSALTIVRRVLARSLRRLWPFFGLLALTTLGAMAAELAPPLLLRRILDQYLYVNITKGLWRVALLYVGALVFASSVGFAQTMVTTYIGQNALLDMRLLTARHLSQLPMSYYNATPVGETMSRLTADVDAVEALFSAGLINAITDAFKIVGIVIAMYAISPLLCAVALLATPVVFGLAEFFRRGTLAAQMNVRRSVSEINTFLQETFSGVRTLKAYGQEGRVQERFQAPLLENLKAENRSTVYFAYFPCVMQVVRALTIAIVIWLGARNGATAAVGVSVGGLAAMADLIGRLFGPIESLSQEFQTIQRAVAGLRRVADLLSQPPEERGERQHLSADPQVRPGEAVLTVRDAVFGYLPGRPVLRGVSLTLRAGQKAAIVGRTGAGKTTLLNLVAGLYRPDQGEISICGYDPHRLDPRDRRHLLGVVPQQMLVFEGTVAENITLRDESISREQVIEAARTVGLHETILKLPQGYDTPLGEGGGKFSHGETQLLALARAIVSNPPLLLLDEPTSGLDAVTERAVFDAFRTAGQNRTILTISHRLSGVLDADVVHIMAQGQVVQSGAPDELAGQRGWYSVFKQLEDLGWQTGS